MSMRPPTGPTPPLCTCPVFGAHYKNPLYNAVNFDHDPVIGSDNPAKSLTVVNLRLAAFLCPSDSNSGSGQMINNYHLSNGVTAAVRLKDVTGAFAFHRAYSIANFTDGTSNTVLMSEGLVGSGRTAPGGGFRKGDTVVGLQWGHPTTGHFDVTLDVPSLDSMIKDCGDLYNSGTNVGTNRGHRWAWGSEGITIFNTILAPNTKLGGCREGCWDAVCPTGIKTDTSHLSAATSNHPGGVNVLFGDGSVKFVKDTINRATWWALGTRTKGEVVSADSY